MKIPLILTPEVRSQSFGTLTWGHFLHLGPQREGKKMYKCISRHPPTHTWMLDPVFHIATLCPASSLTVGIWWTLCILGWLCHMSGLKSFYGCTGVFFNWNPLLLWNQATNLIIITKKMLQLTTVTSNTGWTSTWKGVEQCEEMVELVMSSVKNVLLGKRLKKCRKSVQI